MKLTMSKLKEIIREEIQKLNEGTKLKMPKTADEARNENAKLVNSINELSDKVTQLLNK